MLLINVINKLLAALLLCSIFSITYASNETDRKQDILLDKNIQNILDIDRMRYQLPAISVSIKLPGEIIL